MQRFNPLYYVWVSRHPNFLLHELFLLLAAFGNTAQRIKSKIQLNEALDFDVVVTYKELDFLVAVFLHFQDLVLLNKWCKKGFRKRFWAKYARILILNAEER